MNILKPAVLSALILAVPALAAAQINLGDKLGSTTAEITAALEAAGYTVTEIEMKNGKIEVETRKDGTETEFVLATKDGTVLKTEMDDD